VKPQEIRKDVYFLGVPHWERRLFDSLIPLPDGTSYNAYLVKGKNLTILIDTVEPAVAKYLFQQLEMLRVDRIDYIVSQHTEQDHSGSIPMMLEKYPEATVLCSKKAFELLKIHLNLPEERLRVVEDGEIFDIGGKTLRFIYTPWVHWPETMCTYLEEERLLFTCDFFGSHLATYSVYASEDERTELAAKRYYAEIMAPFRSPIRNNLKKLDEIEIEMICPSHGPIHDVPARILDLYRTWSGDSLDNLTSVFYVSMHGSTVEAVDYLCDALVKRGVKVKRYDLVVSDLGEIAMALVDSASLVVAAPTVLNGLHPLAIEVVYLADRLRAKAKGLGAIISYGWGSMAQEQLKTLMPGFKEKWMRVITFRGFPSEDTFREVEELANEIACLHEQLRIKL